MTALRRRGRFDLASAQAEQLLKIAAIARDQRPEQTAELVPSVQLSAGQTLLLTGAFRDSMPALHRAYDWSADSTFDYIEPDAAASLALSHAIDGRTDITESWLARHASSPQTSTWMEVGIRGKASAAQLLLALDRLDLDAARMHARSDPLDERLGMQEWWAFRIYAQARHALHTGTALDALDTVDGARTRFHAWIEHSAAGPLLAAAETDLLIALGRGNQARTVAHGPHKNHPLLRTAQARLALFAGQNDTALRLATDTDWQRRSTTRARHEMHLVQAIAAQRSGDLVSAVRALQQATDSSHATGALRPFTTVPREELAGLAMHVPAAAEILNAPAVAASRELFPERLELIELTNRERQVLERIAAGLSIHQVATALRVSYSTVRTQQRSLYRKLQAESQSDAITRAQQAGLLSRELSPV
jgi:LuxR family maltose regulon positive regulatory protein